ncbi:MAG: heme-binding protein [Myxococcales bacterium]|nr:heme-binding protein [Myxococcales bacterium]
MKTFEKRSLQINAAKKIIKHAEAKAEELGMKIAITIVDESGVLKAFSRMDGAPLIAVGASRKKAVTAVGFGLSTGSAWYEFIKDDPILMHGAQSFDDFTLLGGGLAIIVDGQIVGAVGVSGGHYSHDEQCAKAGLAALEGSD